MKNFSNEIKRKRIKAMLKVSSKRYPFILLVPALLVLSYFIGMIAAKVMLTMKPSSFLSECGWFCIIILGVCVVDLLGLIYLGCSSLVKYLKKGTVVKDFIANVNFALETFEDIYCFFNSLPTKTVLRLRKEKRRFDNAIQEEIEKELS